MSQKFVPYLAGTMLGITLIAATACSDSTSSNAVTQISLSGTAISLTPGETYQLYAIPEAADSDAVIGPKVTWTSSNTAVATVDTTGLVTAVSVGADTVTAADGSVKNSAIITVTSE